MEGIDLNRDIKYLHSSLRFFKDKEYHISRVCQDDVLLLVYDGILRFSEDGKKYEIGAGSYHIQRHGSVQKGWMPSDAPKYLYVHFMGEWTKGEFSLPASGEFDYHRLKYIMEELDTLSHEGKPYVLQAGKFYELLSRLYPVQTVQGIARKTAEYLEKEYGKVIDLGLLAEELNYSKNHIINTFKKEFGVTPITYLNSVRLRNSEYLIEATSRPIEEIALECGYPNYSHFYRLFVRKNAISPEVWRREKRMGRIK